MSLAHLENARAMHLENESLELLSSREFSRKGVDFSHKKRLAQSHRVRGMLDRMRTNARKLVRLFFSLFPSLTRSVALLFRILCDKTSSLLRCFTRRRRQMYAVF